MSLAVCRYVCLLASHVRLGVEAADGAYCNVCAGSDARGVRQILCKGDTDAECLKLASVNKLYCVTVQRELENGEFAISRRCKMGSQLEHAVEMDRYLPSEETCPRGAPNITSHMCPCHSCVEQGMRHIDDGAFPCPRHTSLAVLSADAPLRARLLDRLVDDIRRHSVLMKRLCPTANGRRAESILWALLGCLLTISSFSTFPR